MQETARYRQIRSMILEEVAAAERLQASLEAERPLPGAKGGLFRMSATDRAMLWRPLADRLGADGPSPSEEELAELWREYEWASAMQIRLPRRVAWYQLGLLTAVAILAVAPFELISMRSSHLSDILPYLLASFWGMVGGSAGSLWQLLKEVEGRSFASSSGLSHLLRPALGAVLGLLVSLILPARMLNVEGPDLNLTGYVLVALAGLSERTVVAKLQQLLEALLGQAMSAKAAAPVTSGARVAAVPLVTPVRGAQETAVGPIVTAASSAQSSAPAPAPALVGGEK